MNGQNRLAAMQLLWRGFFKCIYFLQSKKPRGTQCLSSQAKPLNCLHSHLLETPKLNLLFLPFRRVESFWGPGSRGARQVQVQSACCWRRGAVLWSWHSHYCGRRQRQQPSVFIGVLHHYCLWEHRGRHICGKSTGDGCWHRWALAVNCMWIAKRKNSNTNINYYQSVF